MRNTPSDARPERRRWPALPVAAIVAVLACGCSPDTTPSAKLPAPGPDVVRGIERALDRRADAVRRHDDAAFRAGLDSRQPRFVAEQTAYLAGLRQLPVDRFGYRLDPATVVRDADGWWGTVAVTLRLHDYDARAVVARDRFHFTRRHGRFVLSSVTDRRWESLTDPDPQPWDLGAVHVLESGRVLGVFDAGSVATGPALVADVERALSDVAEAVPLDWSQRVVVYALSDPTYLSELDDVPGGDPLALDAVSVQVLSGAGAETLAATRVVLHPVMVGRSAPGRDRLLRHELTHVAVGARAVGVPTWLAEGLAEWVSVRPLPPRQRSLSDAAIAAAKAGPTAMPGDDAFHGAGSTADYGLAWWACEYVARTYGEHQLWWLLDRVRGSDPESALEDALGLTSAQLAARAARLMLLTYGRGSPVQTGSS